MNCKINSIKSDCEQTERYETEMIDTIGQQFNREEKAFEVECKPDISVFNDNELILPNNDLIDENVFEMNEQNNKTINVSNRTDSCDELEDINGLEDYIGLRVVDGKERHFCQWSDCRFESNQRSCITRHVLNRHLNPKQENPFETIDTYDESKYWDKIMNNNKDWLQRSHSNGVKLQKLPSLTEALSGSVDISQPLPKPPLLTPFAMESTSHPPNNQLFIDDKQWLERMSSMATLQASLQASISSQNSSKSFDNKINFDDSFEEKDVLMKNHLNISNNEENILLSCKGLASMSKVRDYYESQVINGEKYFFCKWMRCQFKTKKSQKIAQHINLSHIGVEFKCNKPNCYKVFKNPNTYREHQKNHICGFGIFGYGSKGVIGVCRNESLNQYRERVIIDSKKFYRCKWNGNGIQCNAITRYHMAMKRHIHNHVCPYRVNLKLKQNQDVINDIKSETWNLDLGLGSIPSTSGGSQSVINTNIISNTNNNNNNAIIKKTYQCRRIKCRASFSNNADLLKHENLLCKFIKNNNLNNNFINNNNIKTIVGPKAQEKQKPIMTIEELGENRVINEQTVRKSTVPQMNGNKSQNNSINANIRRMKNVEKYFSTKVMNGVDYHLCIYNDCKFANKLLHKTIDHIQTQHFGLESQLNNESNLSTNCGQNSNKRVHSLTESPEPDSSKENSSKKCKTIEIIVNSADTSVVENKVAKNTIAITEQHFAKHMINGETNYFCEYKDCEYYTKHLNQIKVHVNEAHNLICDQLNCGKQFRTSFALSQHKVNHICGFGIKGRKPTGVCDFEHIRQFRDEVMVDGRSVYPCKWIGCHEIFENKSIALSHIHNRHVCPNRLSSIVPQNSSTFNRNIVKTIIETNRKNSNANQSFKTNDNTIEIIEL